MRSTAPFRSFVAIAAILLAACSGELPSVGAGPAPADAHDEALAASLDELAASAARDGDALAAETYADGALAIRLGATPTEIAVIVDGQGHRYWAVMMGIVERGPDGAELLKRSLVAWTGEPRPAAILKAVARTDEAAFGRDHDDRVPGQATGSWVDVERAHRFIAIDGSFASVVSSIGGACPNAAHDRRFACNLARFDVRMDGTFELAGDQTVRLPIATSPDGVGGVVVRRTDGGRGGRPTVAPSRPVPTRG